MSQSWELVSQAFGVHLYARFTPDGEWCVLVQEHALMSFAVQSCMFFGQKQLPLGVNYVRWQHAIPVPGGFVYRCGGRSYDHPATEVACTTTNGHTFSRVCIESGEEDVIAVSTGSWQVQGMDQEGMGPSYQYALWITDMVVGTVRGDSHLFVLVHGQNGRRVLQLTLPELDLVKRHELRDATGLAPVVNTDGTQSVLVVHEGVHPRCTMLPNPQEASPLMLPTANGEQPSWSRWQPIPSTREHRVLVRPEGPLRVRVLWWHADGTTTEHLVNVRVHEEDTGHTSIDGGAVAADGSVCLQLDQGVVCVGLDGTVTVLSDEPVHHVVADGDAFLALRSTEQLGGTHDAPKTHTVTVSPLQVE